jgi:Pyruvate/2-oxoacid:ferredoxin oxidoreductase delta subunit
LLAKYIFNKLSAEKYPRQQAGRCINQRVHGEQCEICRFACPNKAISCRGGVHFDGRQCEGCGICTTACPTRCLLPVAQPGRILQAAVMEKDPVIGCECGGSAVNVRVPCLAGQPWELLAAIVLMRQYGPVTLNISACFCCKKRKSLWQLFRTLQKLNLFLGEQKYQNSVQLLFENAPKEQTLSRREMFNLLRQRSGNLARETAGTFLATEKDSAVNPFRRIFEKVLSEKLESGADCNSYRLPLWEVGEQCSGCGLCQAVCPHGAWELNHGKDSRAQLLYRPWRCTECGLCAQACPQKAKQKISPAFHSNTTVPSVQKVFTLSECRKCLSQIVGEGSNLCGQCAKREELKKGILTL